MKLILILPITLILAACNQVTQKQQADIIINHANVINMMTGQITANQSIVIKNSTIVACGGNELNLRYSATSQIDASGQYVMPGL